MTQEARERIASILSDKLCNGSDYGTCLLIADDIIAELSELGYCLPPKLELIGEVGSEITYAVDKGRTGEIRTTKLTRRDIRVASFQFAADQKAIEGVK